jgi:hypothetical protein
LTPLQYHFIIIISIIIMSSHSSSSITSSTSSDNVDDAVEDAVTHPSNSNTTNTTTTPAAEAGTTTCSAELRYRNKKQSLKTLAALCRGLKDDNDNDLMDIKSYPWCKLKVSSVKPTAKDYREEIGRRYDELLQLSSLSNTQLPLSLATRPRPKAWSATKLVGWLDSHPVMDSESEDYIYLTQVVSERKKLAEEKARRQPQEGTTEDAGSSNNNNNNNNNNMNWTGKFPYLRLIHCLVDNDRIQRAYLRRNNKNISNNQPGRLHPEESNHDAAADDNNDERAPTVWELMSELYNDPNFSPHTECIRNLHTDFLQTETLSYSLVKRMLPATPEKCKHKFCSMMVQMKQCIAKWERHCEPGKEGGNTSIEPQEESDDDADDDEQDGAAAPSTTVVGLFGSLTNRSKVAMDSRQSFFPRNRSYLLYLWHMLDKHHLLTSTSLHQFNLALSNGIGDTALPLTIPESAPTAAAAAVAEEQEEEDDESSWESALHSTTTNSTIGNSSSRRSVVDLTVVAESIQALVDKAASAVALHCRELEKNRRHDAKEREKTRILQKLEREKDRIHQESERKKNHVHQTRLSLDERISKLRAEKRKLAYELVLAKHTNTDDDENDDDDDDAPPHKKKNKAMIQLLQQHIQQVENETAHDEREMNSLME